MNWVGFIIMGLFALAIGLGVFHIFSGLASGARRIQSKRRDEALFASMFPDLQPYFHPERLVEFVRAQRSRKRGSVTTSGGTTWENPPGLGVHQLEIEQGNMRVPYRMRDESGALLGQFLYDTHADGGVLRVGQGKLTVNVKDAIPRVRYWHPRREFKWSRKNGWVFVTPVADTHDTGYSTDSHSSSRSFSSTSDRGSDAPVGGGGTFDGGGASGGWDAEPSSSTTSY